jgi:hypothetical protein
MFQVKPHDPKPLIWWYAQRDKIDMNPSYQREGQLWDKEKKSRLIDSILNDFDIPKIYLADFNPIASKLNERKRAYAVIDGKQRLETVFEFLDGDAFTLHKDFKLNAEPKLKLGGLSYLDLKLNHSRVAEKLESYVPAIMSVITDEEDKVDEMFVRLNSGLEINGAERRNAMPGIVPRLIRHMVKLPFFVNCISFDTKRMSQYNLAAKILLIEDRRRFVDTKARNLDKFVEEGVTKDTRGFKDAAEAAKHVLHQMASEFRERDPLLRSAGAIPLYYWLMRQRPDKSKYIRPFLERFLKDLRANFELANEDPKSANAELTNYYTMSRTTNDQGSYNGRYAILERRLKRFIRTRD